MTKLYEKELIILINASTQLFFPVKHMKSLSGKDYFISTFQNYWEIIHSDTCTCIWQMGRHFPW